MKILLALIIIGIVITGCIERTANNTDKENFSKENLSSKNWYQYIYDGPPDVENSENARMAVIPHLRELGWMQGISVVYGKLNNSIVILIPFQLTDKSIGYINETLENYSFSPVRLNEVVKIEERSE